MRKMIDLLSVAHPISTSPAPTYATDNFLVTIGLPAAHPHIVQAYSALHSDQQSDLPIGDHACVLLVLDSASHPIGGFDTIRDPHNPAQLIASHFCYLPRYPEIIDVFARAVWHILSVHSADSIVIKTHSSQIIAAFPALHVNGAKDVTNVSLTISTHDFHDLSPDVRKIVLLERGYLSPFFSRTETSHQIIFDHPYHDVCREALIEKASVNLNILDSLLQEARKCGYGAQVDECPPWHHPFVYLPWRNSLTRILVSDLYHKVRLDRNRYKLTSSEMDTLREKVVGVIGLSVGASIAFCLAQQGLCGHLRLADLDCLELSNLNRLASSFADIGMHKVDIIRQRIAEIDPYLPVTTFRDGIIADNARQFASGLSVIVEECDSIDVKLLIRQHAQELRIPVIMETNDNGILDIERYDLHEDLAPFHGLVGNIPLSNLSNLTTEQKLGFLAKILDFNSISTRVASSALEINSTLSSWPQLAEDVALGTSLAAGACRRILLEFSAPTGRTSVNINRIISEISAPQQVPVSKAPQKKRTPLPADDLEAVERATHLAPSGGNAQPWKFEVDDKVVKISLRDDAIPTVIDWKWRASLVGCGAALCNAWCVAANRKIVQRPDRIDVKFIPDDAEDCRLCGQFELGQCQGVLEELADMVVHRVSNRRNVTPKAVPNGLVEMLQNTVKPFGVRLIYVAAGDVDAGIIDPFAEGHRIRLFCEQTHKELFHEIREADSDCLHEGLDVRTFEFSAVDKAALQLLRNYANVRLLREWNLGHRLSELSTKALKGCDGILFYTVSGCTKQDYARAGFGLEASLLRAVQMKVGINIIWPLFGGGNTTQDLCDMVGVELGTELAAAKTNLEKRLGLEADESFLCCVRLLHGEGPSAISGRRVPT